ncbi:MAG TPA: branched-chain amino acid ABC transporter permease [Mesotoga infera]|uniref:Branched-chain amino acid ABC transporter permease n=1 Tax=Mesotoga infera TaxID=1236046 RepID=A0A7C1H941_9BACT|nr:branched-chain amino acid ABC transporter permease [Mesotoga infera]
MSLDAFFQHLVNGISLGFIFGLIAIGYTLVYGVVKLVNFAHGEVFMMAAFFVFFGFTLFSMPWWLAVVIGIALTMVLGVGIERIAYRPLRNAPRISSLCAAIGMSFLLQNLAVVMFGGRQKSFYVPPFLATTINVGGVKVQAVTVATIVVSGIVLVILTFLINRTKMGLAMRALSVDFDTAKLMGINVNRTIAFTFALGSALAALSAILWALRYPQIWPFMGFFPGWRAFTAAIIGGIGSVIGALFGGFMLGMITILLVAFFPAAAGYRDAIIFVLLVVILLVKPTGIFGEKMSR